jgi:glycerol 2-dehydrogenase (NADP+)
MNPDGKHSSTTLKPPSGTLAHHGDGNDLPDPPGNDDRFPKLPNGERDIIHSHNHVDTWKQMEKLVATGKTKAIGVSNVCLPSFLSHKPLVLTTFPRLQYSKRYLEELLPHATIVPAVNQIENHPALPQQEIVDLCNEKGIHIMAYSPLGSTGSPLFTAEPVVAIAEKHGVKPAAVLLSYHRAFTPFSPLPLSLSSHERGVWYNKYSANQ